MNQKIIDQCSQIVGADYCITDEEHKKAYFYDEIEEILRPKANEHSIVVKPGNPEEVSKILQLANEGKIPVVTRGGGTGLCGGAIPIFESIILSMERLNKIVEIDKGNMMAVLETGVTLAALLEELERHPGIGFPVHPGDEGAHIGGMAVTNAGGARAVKHGVMRKQIHGLEVVLANGEILQLGGKLIKDNAGYNLMNLIIGSEGTLAVITKVILKLYPQDKYSGTIIASFNSLEDASAVCLELLASDTTPLAVEYQDKHLFTGTAEMMGKKWQLEKGVADLMIILSEADEKRFYSACEQVYEICQRNGSCEQYFAGRKNEQVELLLIRSQHYEYIKHMIGHSFDLSVPVGSVPAFLRDLKTLVAGYDTVTNITAHIADGNIHNDIVLVDGKMPEYAEELKNKMYELCFKYGGSITGEHGVGKLRCEDLHLQKSKTELDLMRGIKKTFDPNSILNPGTVLEMR
jgi:glycolate oxidase